MTAKELSEVVIKRASPNEIRSIARASKSYEGKVIGNPIDTFPRNPIFKGQIVFVAKINGKIIGYIWGGLSFFNKKNTAEIHSIGVKKNFRLIGIGSALTKNFSMYFAKRGVTTLVCFAHTHEGVEFFRRVAPNPIPRQSNGKEEKRERWWGIKMGPKKQRMRR
jgi:ribosomal protein S18 acetylase RimI-like enzyme